MIDNGWMDAWVLDCWLNIKRLLEIVMIILVAF